MAALSSVEISWKLYGILSERIPFLCSIASPLNYFKAPDNTLFRHISGPVNTCAGRFGKIFVIARKIYLIGHQIYRLSQNQYAAKPEKPNEIRTLKKVFSASNRFPGT